MTSVSRVRHGAARDDVHVLVAVAAVRVALVERHDVACSQFVRDDCLVQKRLLEARCVTVGEQRLRVSTTAQGGQRHELAAAARARDVAHDVTRSTGGTCGLCSSQPEQNARCHFSRAEP